jgi:hypothetical protein
MKLNFYSSVCQPWFRAELDAPENAWQFDHERLYSFQFVAMFFNVVLYFLERYVFVNFCTVEFLLVGTCVALTSLPWNLTFFMTKNLNFVFHYLTNLDDKIDYICTLITLAKILGGCCIYSSCSSKLFSLYIYGGPKMSSTIVL